MCKTQFKALVDERVHLENLLQQRFNFFIVIFGFALAAGAEIEDNFMRAVCLITLTSVMIIVWLPLYRVGRLADAAMTLIKQEIKSKDRKEDMPSRGWAIMEVRRESGIDNLG